ncbi:hypothetical protein G5B30_07245 [Sphingobacterium sp. SGG-5]|uniref:hypothetical protein n=1 Tax=Sphingobacterium sp. SGG-5 TaxID=2710881 RepID=UPI0013ED2CC7|nr:hypothetical protein [Sphingobacterium sp. SGG-5]NGM61711.1 hypothetical protein [Sphingobacterium sp. SGG-5]
MDKLTYFIGVIFLSLGLVACHSNTEDKGSAGDPGAVTEMDKQRYNLNSNDVTLYDPLDTARADSTKVDSASRADQ